MKNFFYNNWLLYYFLFFLLIGLLIYALLWKPDFSEYTEKITVLNNKLEDCRNIAPLPPQTPIIDTVAVPIRVNCDASVKSGEQGETITQHELGNRSGIVVINYDMRKIPDEIKVLYDNVIVVSSQGPVGNRGDLQFKYNAIPGKPTYCVVIITAPEEGTSWEYVLNCPQ